MSLDAQREAIVQNLEETEGIEGKAKVHEFQRLAKTWNDFMDQFKSDQNKLHGWCVTRINTTEVFMTNCETERFHLWAIRGYYGVEDKSKSELTMQNIIENICETFRKDLDLRETASPGGDDNFRDVGLVQIDSIEPRIFGEVLVHFADLRYRSREILNDISL